MLLSVTDHRRDRGFDSKTPNDIVIWPYKNTPKICLLLCVRVCVRACVSFIHTSQCRVQFNTKVTIKEEKKKCLPDFVAYLQRYSLYCYM